MSAQDISSESADALVKSSDPEHPANRIAELCRLFYTLGWVTGTGGGVSIRHGEHIYLAPSGVQKERMQPEDMFVMEYATKRYLRRPPVGPYLTHASHAPSSYLSHSSNPRQPASESCGV